MNYFGKAVQQYCTVHWTRYNCKVMNHGGKAAQLYSTVHLFRLSCTVVMVELYNYYVLYTGLMQLYSNEQWW